MLDISLVGVGGMMPLPERHLSSMLVRLNGSMLLIDCGEGTQVSLKQLGWGFKNLDHICFTHYHADHIAGLPGLLLTVGNAGRTETMTIAGPSGIKSIVESLCAIAPRLPFNLNFIEIKDAGEFSAGNYKLTCLPLDHDIICLGYCIHLKRAGKFDVERAKQLDIPINFWRALQNGQDITIDGRLFTPDMVMGAERKGLKVAYITDTRMMRSIPSFIDGADLFVCEGMYGDEEKREKANEYGHLTFQDAASLAKEGNVCELWMTHFSPSLPHPAEYRNAAVGIFENTRIGYDRMAKTLVFEP